MAPNIESIFVVVLIFSIAQIPDCLPYRRGVALCTKDIVLGDWGHPIRVEPDDEEPKPTRCRAEIGGVQEHRSQYAISMSNQVQPFLQHSFVAIEAQTPNVFHQKKLRFEAGSETKEVAYKVPARIIGMRTPDFTERLASWPSYP